jgi:hypothetical protein
MDGGRELILCTPQQSLFPNSGIPGTLYPIPLEQFRLVNCVVQFRPRLAPRQRAIQFFLKLADKTRRADRHASQERFDAIALDFPDELGKPAKTDVLTISPGRRNFAIKQQGARMVRHMSLLLAFLAITPAMAGPREDVYSASVRCAAIKDDRSWLECYYGAAQPMRGQLQLPAAPVSQTSLIPPAIAAPVARQQAPNPMPQKEGPIGRTMDFLAGGDIVLSHAPIQSYEGGGPGGFTVILANGQVWKQSDDQARLVKWRGAPETHQVSIWKGGLNTFNLGFDDETDRYKVRRLK